MFSREFAGGLFAIRNDETSLSLQHVNSFLCNEVIWAQFLGVIDPHLMFGFTAGGSNCWCFS